MKALKNSLIVLVFILGVFAVIGSGGGGSDSDGGSSGGGGSCAQPYVTNVSTVNGDDIKVSVANPGRNITGAKVYLENQCGSASPITLGPTTANPAYFDIKNGVIYGCGYHYIGVYLYYCGTYNYQEFSSGPYSVSSMSTDDSDEWEEDEGLIDTGLLDMAPMSENDELDWLSE